MQDPAPSTTTGHRKWGGTKKTTGIRTRLIAMIARARVVRAPFGRGSSSTRAAAVPLAGRISRALRVSTVTAQTSSVAIRRTAALNGSQIATTDRASAADSPTTSQTTLAVASGSSFSRAWSTA